MKRKLERRKVGNINTRISLPAKTEVRDGREETKVIGDDMIPAFCIHKAMDYSRSPGQ